MHEIVSSLNIISGDKSDVTQRKRGRENIDGTVANGKNNWPYYLHYLEKSVGRDLRGDAIDAMDTGSRHYLIKCVVSNPKLMILIGRSQATSFIASLRETDNRRKGFVNRGRGGMGAEWKGRRLTSKGIHFQLSPSLSQCIYEL